MGEPDFGSLRPMVDEDLDRVLEWRNDPSVRRYMYTQHEITRDEHHSWWGRVKNSSKSRFFIYDVNGAPSGYVAFSDINSAAGTASWGFYTRPMAPKGLGSLMTFNAMNEAFGPLGLRKLNGEALECNPASIALHESFGFKREGVFIAQVVIDGKLENVHRLALFADDWKALRATKEKSLSERLTA